MLMGHIMMPLKRSFVLLPQIRICFYSYSPSHNNEIKDCENHQRDSRKLKKWKRNHTESNPRLLGMFNDENTPAHRDDSIDMIRPRIKESSFKFWYNARRQEYLIWRQRFIPERHEILGNHLAATHFVLYRGGKVKRKGDTNYLIKDDLKTIPNVFDPNWVIDEIDMSNTEICYEGLENFKSLQTLKKISFKGCKHFNDWCLEKILCQCPDIEHLDVSDCENVTERGLEGLYRSWYLKKLVVTDYGNGAAFELTCLMLEDCMPGLQVEIIKPPINATISQ